jgi:hypothetical protein
MRTGDHEQKFRHFARKLIKKSAAYRTYSWQGRAERPKSPIPLLCHSGLATSN